MPSIVIYTTLLCPYCVRAKSLLDRKGVDYSEIRVDLQQERWQEMLQHSRRDSVPQIFINERHVGGCDELYALEKHHQLDPLLELA